MNLTIFFFLSLVLNTNDISHLPQKNSESLRIMIWNVLHGANDVVKGAEKTLKIIKKTNPDLVLLQESYDIKDERPKLGKWLSEKLSWNEYQDKSRHLCVLTPLEIKTSFFHDPWHGIGARIKDPKGRQFIAWSIWIDYRSYITYTLRDSPEITNEKLLESEYIHSNRKQQAKSIIEHLKKNGQLNSDVPLLVGGDWNCPSHLDWTKDSTYVYKRRRVLELPVSISMKDAGFTDTFRHIHPNPVQYPGITWSPMFRSKNENNKNIEQGFERIDRLYLKNPSTNKDHWKLIPIRGEVLPIIWENESIPIDQRDFPSDHGALVIDLKWEKTKTNKGLDIQNNNYSD